MSCGCPLYHPLLAPGSALESLHPSVGIDGQPDLTGVRVHCASAHDLSSTAHLTSMIMSLPDDAFIINGYAHACKLLKVAKEQLAVVSNYTHMHQDYRKIASRAMAAQLAELGSKPCCQKRSRQLYLANLPAEKLDPSIYVRYLFEPSIIHRIQGNQGEAMATHLTKECWVIKRLQAGLASSEKPADI